MMMFEVWIERFVLVEGKQVWTMWASFVEEADARSYVAELQKRHNKWKVEVRTSGNHKDDASHREKPTF